jgi:hypothetical protein
MKARILPLPGFLLGPVLIICFFGCKPPQTTGKIPFNEDSVRNHILPIKEAVAYTAKFRSVRDSFYNQLPPLKTALNLGKAEGFNRDAIAVLLNQIDASGRQSAGIRIYFGLDRNGEVRLVLVPYDIDGNDIINELIGNKTVVLPGIPAANAAGTNGQTIENGQRCPVICGNSLSGLNGGN